ncbi:ACY1 bifunctional acylase-like protein [Pseudooceanicola batsensis HTCC2597]|uniref:ACY1 bifunctional acylase-like protein n=1 Tax=Pseudooceanicola batsensis (strain ATCC BAA-863 / DSM 15984 / KCTC 12145 / HTCC2597) TaxID=252305 RepID=A3TY44_PSEBH|nr:ACY1 bifunctional acylase-like protein [Pseudooceanicola batsensis HTCC2597]
MVATQHSQASRVGAQVLKDGGDAVDAAIAVGFALGVVEPWMSGPGGGGAMLIWREDEQKAYALNFGMVSPAALDPADYPLTGQGRVSDLFPWPSVEDDRNVVGATAIAIPGMVAGMEAAHRRFATMPWGDLLAPARDIARAGPLADWYSALLTTSSARLIAQDPDLAAIFLEDGTWPRIGGWTATRQQRLDFSGMAATLDRLIEAGARDFYEGDIAAALVADVQGKGGSLSRDDLRNYVAAFHEPLGLDRGAARIHAMPGLTAGPTLADYFARLPVSGHLDVPAMADALFGAYEHRLATMGHDGETHGSPACTSHFSIVDRHGNMVALTQTLLSIFGSRTLSQSTGLLMNNGIMWFDPEPGKPNSLAPGKPCLMNICPTIVREPSGGFAVGASGGRKIMGAVAQLATMMTDAGMSLEEAFHHPRIDCSGEVLIADAALPREVLETLSAGHRTEARPNMTYPFAWACPSAVHRIDGRNAGCTEVMSPWADALREDDV